MSARPQLDQRVRAEFRASFGYPPSAVAIAPGRINIIGEHTDYSGGLVLPAAIDRFVAVAVRPRRDGQVILASDQYPGVVTLSELPDQPQGQWSDYVVGVARELAVEGADSRGFDAVIASDLPPGAGLGSSAALEGAMAVGLLAAWGMEMPVLEIARLCQRVENTFVGALTGMMDPVAILVSRAANAIALDCRTLHWEDVPLPDARHGFVVADTRVHHDLASAAYNDRRRECEAAAAQLGVRDLHDVTMADLDRVADPRLRRRLRHVVSENARVREAIAALRRRDAAALGPLMHASHASLRDDFEVSSAEQDCLVSLAGQAPASIGARMMGGGFGGSVLALVEQDGLDQVEDRLRDGFVERFHHPPDFYRVRSVDGVLSGETR